MEIKYNGRVSFYANNMITFAETPNIVSITDSVDGTKAVLKLTVLDNWAINTTLNNQWWLEFQGETITNVLEPQNAINKNFYISTYKYSIANSIADALRNCPSIASKFKIYTSVDSSSPDVYLKALSYGNIDLTVNMASGMSSYLSASTTGGTSYSTLSDAKINLNIYSDNEYVTTLSKVMHNGDCKFNISPVLSTITSYGETTPYNVYITATKSATTANIGSITNNNATYGYMVNDYDDYLTLSSGITFALNVEKGNERIPENNTILYVYDESFPVYFYTTQSGSVSYTVSYLDSAYQTISSSTSSETIDASNNHLAYVTPQLHIPANCFYVDISLGGKTLRYNVIKPSKANAENTRIYWRNSYGGIQHFDFVGEKTLSNDYQKITYSKNILDYYETTKKEREKVYNTDVKSTYTVKTHIIEKDGTYTLYDLAKSNSVWTVIDGKTYAVIIESVTVSEVNTQNVFEGTIKYRLSFN